MSIDPTRVTPNSDVSLKLPTIAILAAAVTLFAAPLSNADAACRRGRNAYASAATQADSSPKQPDGARASALRECNKAAEGVNEQIRGAVQLDIYRACMASRGQPE